jgi:Gluconate 2-dehydrogenase subunit 3
MDRLAPQQAKHGERRTVAINTESVDPIEPIDLERLEPSYSANLKRLIDQGTIYVPQALNQSQFATLHTLLRRIVPPQGNPTQLAARLDATLAKATVNTLHLPAMPPHIFDYQLGLDELDSIARSRTGFAFADLTSEIQDAMLGLIASRDLATRKLDLSLWLKGLHSVTATGLTLQQD